MSQQKDQRPWGGYEVLLRGDRYLVKVIEVNPFSRTSLQYHRHREEVWVVVSGTLLNNGVSHDPGSVVHIGMEDIHRIENPSSEPLLLVEVQAGDVLSEDDIVRIEDDYGRE